MSTKRRVYRVRWSRVEGEWGVTSPVSHFWTFGGTKGDAVAAAVRLARAEWMEGRLAQVVVHRKDGKIQSERTFGYDPKRYPG